MTRSRSEQFVSHLAGHPVRINDDARYDMLYVFGPEPWTLESGKKPRTITVASGIQMDALLSDGRVYGVEIEDFEAELQRHGSPELIAWWNTVRTDEPAIVEGDWLAHALQQVSFV